MIWSQLFLIEQNVNPTVWFYGKTVGQLQNVVPVVIKLEDPHLFPHQKEYPLKPDVKEDLKPIIENVKDQGLLIPCNSPSVQFSSSWSLSRVQLCDPQRTTACQAYLSITNSWSLPKHMSIEPMIPSNHLALCCPLLLPSIFPNIMVFSNESALGIRWPKYWSFSFKISHSNEYSGLISFRMNWLDPFAVQRTLKSLIQHHTSKASILQCSAFFTVQPSHPYMPIGKTIALTRWTFVDKVMSLLFNMLSRLVITFLPRSKSLLIS